jgi:hypothetical protein
MEARQQAVESDEASFAGEDAIELCRQGGLALLAWSAPVRAQNSEASKKASDFGAVSLSSRA